MKNAKAKETKYRNYPELKPGIRIQYRDKNEATRTGKIISRRGNTLTVIIGAKYIPKVSAKYRIDIDDVSGYWKGRLKANYQNFTKLEES